MTIFMTKIRFQCTNVEQTLIAHTEGMTFQPSIDASFLRSQDKAKAILILMNSHLCICRRMQRSMLRRSSAWSSPPTS